MKYFIALTFSSHSLSWPLIESFSKRFESFPKSRFFEMALLPPFGHETMSDVPVEDLWDELGDIIENCLIGVEELNLLTFEAIDFTTGRRSANLSFRPTINDNLYHCQEAIKEFLKEEGFQFKKTKNRRKNPEKDLDLLWPVAHFNAHHELEQALGVAQSEFQLPLILRTEAIYLFEKTANGPKVLRKFFTFAPNTANLELERYHFAG